MEYTKVQLELAYDTRTKESVFGDKLKEEYELILEDLMANTPIIMMDSESFKSIRFGILKDWSQDKDQLLIKTDVATYEFKIL